MQLPALKTSRLPWCAVQTNAQPLMHTNRKCGLGDGDESDLEWLEAEIPRQVNIWTAASAGLAQTITDCCCTYHQTGDLHQEEEEEEVPPLVSQGGWQGDKPGILGTVLGLPAQKSTSPWKVVNVEPKVKRKSDAALSSHQLRHSSLLICEGRSELCGVMQEGETLLFPATHTMLSLYTRKFAFASATGQFLLFSIKHVIFDHFALSRRLFKDRQIDPKCCF